MAATVLAAKCAFTFGNSMNYAIIDSTGLVVNVIEWDGIKPWQPPVDHTAIPLTDGGIGWTFVDGQFVPPPEPELT
jgi:hypothetical protein